MGICSSCDSTNVATVKLILVDGRLQEYPYPIKVSYVLQKNPSIFICNSDEMDFDDVISAVSDDEDLLPGQLYFALPLSRLRHRLKAEEMAALAVKASSALTKSAGGGICGEKCGNIVLFSGESGVNLTRKVTDSGNVAESGSERRRRCGGSGRRGKFTKKLNAIAE